MKFLLVLSVFVAACSAVPSIKEEWAKFKAKHGKSYRNDNEEHFRLGVYLSNKEMIEEHNARYRAGLESYKMKLNHFSDQLAEEVSRRLNGFNKTGMADVRQHSPVFSRSSSRGRLPASVDWREKGAVTPVKDQGQCGGCWAFSATGALEAQVYLKTGKLVSLSEQNLIDCSRDFRNLGCDGGLMIYAFDYIQENRGIDSEESYPYEGADNECRFRRSAVAATDNGYVSVAQDEESLMEAVATVGPISVAINAGQRSFLHYAGGVYDDEACSQFTVNHGVLVVGYGSEDGQDYWLIKNSWNSDWGEDGYVKIARNQGNLCGVASMPSYPRL